MEFNMISVSVVAEGEERIDIRCGDSFNWNYVTIKNATTCEAEMVDTSFFTNIKSGTAGEPSTGDGNPTDWLLSKFEGQSIGQTSIWQNKNRELTVFIEVISKRSWLVEGSYGTRHTQSAALLEKIAAFKKYALKHPLGTQELTETGIHWFVCVSVLYHFNGNAIGILPPLDNFCSEEMMIVSATWNKCNHALALREFGKAVLKCQGGEKAKRTPLPTSKGKDSKVKPENAEGS